MRYNNLNIQNDILQILKRDYNFKISSLKFLPIGEESLSYLVQLQSGQKFFVKYCQDRNVVKNIDNINRLLLQLKDLDFIVPPVEVNKKTSFKLGAGKTYVYPYIAGQIISQSNEQFDKELVDRLTKIVAEIHNSANKVSVLLVKENFKYDFTNRYESLIKSDNKEKFDLDIWQLLQDNKTVLFNLISKHNEIAKLYQISKPKLVLTHGDITGLNLIRSKTELKLTDWDGAYFAPKERDLMFLIDHPYFSLKKYYQLTSENSYDIQLVKYYQQDWALNSIIGNFEDLINHKKVKKTKQDYIEEINQYLGYYK
ncbi:MAG: phosphotransferase [Patescibacteria group bacterium]|nr:phosphotransferase [Patescibacteria group bacterium]